MVRALFLVAGLAWGAIVVAPGVRHAEEVGGTVCDSSSEPERSSLRVPTCAAKVVVRCSGNRLPTLGRAPEARAAAHRDARLFRPARDPGATLKPGQHLVATAPPRGPPAARA